MLNSFSLQPVPPWEKPTKGTLTCVGSCFSHSPFLCHSAHALNVSKEAEWEEGKERGEGGEKAIAPSSPCDVLPLPKKRDTTHFQDKDQAAASVYSAASAAFSSLDAIPEIIS